MNAKHTPGPWGRNIKPASRYPIIFAGRNTHVAQVITRGLPENECEANADLIAAAPELLAACQTTLDSLANMTGEDFSNGADRILRAALSAVIAKAEGTT